MTKKLLIAALAFFGTSAAFAQEVPRKLLVEHYTNTRCSACASRNPGFYNNYNSTSNGQFLHVAYHPSRPYSSCVLSQQNTVENDERTKYYGIFGGTPRLVINGNVIPAATNYNSSSIFSPYTSLTSPIQLEMTQQKFGTDSIRVKVVVRTVASHSLGSQNLYVMLVQDTLFYNAPNGESQHYDVHRKSLTGNTGMVISVGANVGDSVVYRFSAPGSMDWDMNRIYAIALLQNESDKELTQSEATTPSASGIVSVPFIAAQNNLKARVYPTVTRDMLTVDIDNTGEPLTLRLMSLTGKLVQQQVITDDYQLSLSGLPNGMYIVQLEDENGQRFISKVIKSE